MTNDDLEQSITTLTTNIPGHMGVCAETIDGSQSISINADEVYPAASSIKIFVLFTLLARADANQLSLGERIELTAEFSKPGSGVLSHLDPGLCLSLKDLATLMMMISDNSALMMLLDYLGLAAINEQISGLELEHTKMGDWSNFETDYTDSLSFGQSTPREFVRFILSMRRDGLLSVASQQLFWDILRIQKYINPIRKHLPASPWAREFNMPETVWVASKSGCLDDCSTESGLVNVNTGGWAISVMLKDLPDVGADPDNTRESLISEVSLQVYNAWSPLFD
jgi:beta-lactamase class A